MDDAFSTPAAPLLRPAEFWFDAAIHVAGLCLAVVGIGVLLAQTASSTLPGAFTTAAIYSVALITMLGMSAAYHLLPHPSLKPHLRRLDQAAIFLKIAATYTPFAAAKMEPPWGIGLLVVVWSIALLGAGLKLTLPHMREWISLTLYVALGWAGLAVAGPLVAALDTTSLVLLATGGIVYTAGVAFYVLERLPFQRAIWHAFVLAGTCLHWAAIQQALLG